MYVRYLLRVLFVFILFWCLLNIYKSEETIFQTTKFNLKLTIEYLINSQLVQSKFCKENDKITDIKNKSILSEYEKECPNHRYRIRIIERSPLIIYIEKFLRENEIKHLIELAEPFFKPSMIYEDNGTSSRNDHRTSSSAYLKRHHTSIVKCIEQRFAQFQGDIELNRMEPFQIVKYTHNQQFKEHYDWFKDSEQLKNGGQRITTFFTYLQANCSMGETEFFDIKFNKTFHQRFCDILICDKNSSQHGIRFRPLAGNSIFWFNLDELGQVDYLTYHAGRPPGVNGHKIGLNTWTRERKFSWPFEN